MVLVAERVTNCQKVYKFMKLTILWAAREKATIRKMDSWPCLNGWHHNEPPTSDGHVGFLFKRQQRLAFIRSDRPCFRRSAAKSKQTKTAEWDQSKWNLPAFRLSCWILKLYRWNSMELWRVQCPSKLSHGAIARRNFCHGSRPGILLVSVLAYRRLYGPYNRSQLGNKTDICDTLSLAAEKHIHICVLHG